MYIDSLWMLVRASVFQGSKKHSIIAGQQMYSLHRPSCPLAKTLLLFYPERWCVSGMNNMLICWKRENNMATVKLRFSCESSPGHSVYFPFLYFLTTAGLCSALISDVKLQMHRARSIFANFWWWINPSAFFSRGRSI